MSLLTRFKKLGKSREALSGSLENGLPDRSEPRTSNADLSRASAAAERIAQAERENARAARANNGDKSDMVRRLEAENAHLQEQIQLYKVAASNAVVGDQNSVDGKIHLSVEYAQLRKNYIGVLEKYEAQRAELSSQQSNVEKLEQFQTGAQQLLTRLQHSNETLLHESNLNQSQRNRLNDLNAQVQTLLGKPASALRIDDMDSEERNELEQLRLRLTKYQQMIQQVEAAKKDGKVVLVSARGCVTTTMSELREQFKIKVSDGTLHQPDILPVKSNANALSPPAPPPPPPPSNTFGTMIKRKLGFGSKSNASASETFSQPSAVQKTSAGKLPTASTPVAAQPALPLEKSQSELNVELQRVIAAKQARAARSTTNSTPSGTLSNPLATSLSPSASSPFTVQLRKTTLGSSLKTDISPLSNTDQDAPALPFQVQLRKTGNSQNAEQNLSLSKASPLANELQRALAKRTSSKQLPESDMDAAMKSLPVETLIEENTRAPELPTFEDELPAAPNPIPEVDSSFLEYYADEAKNQHADNQIEQHEQHEEVENQEHEQYEEEEQYSHEYETHEDNYEEESDVEEFDPNVVPEGWEVIQDPSLGTYYYHAETDTKTTRHPSENVHRRVHH